MNQVASKKDILAQSRGEARSQATTIEQSRAIAEVQGALIVAERRPRAEAMAMKRALESCKTVEVAERAFFKFPRGNQTVQGETIHLAVELARCWGNIAYGIWELDRDDARGQSEMAAFAWDLETNTQSRMGFIVPHKRDKKGGAEVLTDMRDIYENNANMGARRLRECIFRVLPPHLIEQARETCRKVLETGSAEKPIVVQIAEMIAAFESIGISRARIEQKVGPIDNLTGVDLANLKISYRSVTRQEVSAEEEFPRVGAEETAKAVRDLAAKPKPDTQSQPKPSGPDDTLPSSVEAASAGAPPAGNDAGPEAASSGGAAEAAGEAGGEQSLSELTLALDDALKAAADEFALAACWNESKPFRKRLKEEAPAMLEAVTRTLNQRREEFEGGQA